MRVRVIVTAVCVGFLVSVASGGPARACQVCTAQFSCADQAVGAKICVERPGACLMAIHCPGGGVRLPEGTEEGLLTATLFDTDVAAAPGLESEAGPLALGEEARGPRRTGRGRLADAMLVHGSEYAAMFVDAGGGGFALRREEAGGATRVQVLEVTFERAGRVLAEGLLGPRDRLTAKVTVEGRERVLVVQAMSLPGLMRRVEVARLRGSLRAAGRSLPVRERPLFELRAM